MKKKVCFFDVETQPNVGYTWGIWEQNVIKVIKEWEILSFSYKWLGEKEVFFLSKKNKKNDKILMTKLKKILDEADVVVAHNGKKFDNKKVKTRMLKHNILPPSPYRFVDTKEECSKNFGLNSNSLNEVAKFLGVGTKIDAGGFKTWEGCMENNDITWNHMKKYNKWDVVVLERVYKKILPWIKNHPNIAERGKKQCPKCASSNLISRGFTDKTRTQVYRRFCCKNCGGWCRSTKVEKLPKLEMTNE